MNDGKATLSSSLNHTFWDKELNNPFKDIDFSLSVLDDKLYPLFEKINHPIAILITQLLKVTSGFLHTTEFNQSSAESKTEKDLKNLFVPIVEALKNAQNALSQESQVTIDQSLLNTAINYCKTFIALRLSILQKLPNNKLYNFYHNHCTELQQLLANPKPPVESNPNHTKHMNS